MHRALAAEQWDEVERLIGEEWKLRRTNAPGISTPLIDKLMEATMANGARAAKVCGAGGGGCVIALIEKGTRQRGGRRHPRAGRSAAEFPGCSRGFSDFTRRRRGKRPGYEHVHRRQGKAAAALGSPCFLCCYPPWHSSSPATSPPRLPSSIPSAWNSSSAPCGPCCLLGIFIWLLTVGDHVEDHRIAAQGLPRVKGLAEAVCAGHFVWGARSRPWRSRRFTSSATSAP